jgi:hypothetical protein
MRRCWCGSLIKALEMNSAEWAAPHDHQIGETCWSGSHLPSFRKSFEQFAFAARFEDGAIVLPACSTTFFSGQTVAAGESLDHADLGEHLRMQGFSTIVGEVKYAANVEWAKPWVLHIQFQGVNGNDLEPCKKPGTQVIICPKELASGKRPHPSSP